MFRTIRYYVNYGTVKEDKFIWNGEDIEKNT